MVGTPAAPWRMSQQPGTIEIITMPRRAVDEESGCPRMGWPEPDSRR
jgi:hypothetical protein